MRHGFSVPNFGWCGDALVLAELAREAEDAGWDGFFLWDHLQWPDQEPAADPWVALTAIAMRTERIRMGPIITPVPRRHVAKLARETATLDRLSGGRLVLGAGAGADQLPEYGAFGDPTDRKLRAERLDEGLEALTALWSGEPVKLVGRHTRIECDAFAPPIQRPRIPIWVGATWPFRKPFRRAARWDGVVPIMATVDDGDLVEPEDLRAIVSYVRDHGAEGRPFEVVATGWTEGSADTARVAACAQAGATWWLESIVTWISSHDDVLARLADGPPRLPD